MNELERSLAFVPTAAQISHVRSLPRAELLRFSVVVPSFNQCSFLRQTLDSVLAQDYPNIEIFVADGGSTDGSVAILEEYSSIHPQLLRYDSRPDGGHHHGVNKGIANTTGDIIAWINSDDIYLPGAFWKVATFFYFNRLAFVVYGRNRYVDRDLNPVIDYPVDWSPLLSEQRRRMMHFCLIPQPSLFFKRTAVTLCGALNSKILDYELWMRWQKDLPFYFCDDYFSLSRLHDDAITANADRGLLRGICEAVHQYYGIVPFSWTFKYAYTAEHGAAWTRGEAPSPGRKVLLMAHWYWVMMNLRWLPRLALRSARGLMSWAAQALRIAA
ncbi:glycosyltransferase family 2 protein [Bradyrhizobium iriomotense]|uniref:glycosyltransferase family 2 protein n=1 Tax=Bradyrhizobium iriomotense TaxID=441950 RepID=UPI001B8A37F1|nr:glycosyltransferase family 2 protein [Bradyrhizobium iriomotense]MBR1133265.1 glycosyltransferase [Bradyrhizobium iriomotense]